VRGHDAIETGIIFTAETVGLLLSIAVSAAGIASVQMTDSFSGSAPQPQPPAPHPQLPVTGVKRAG